MRAETICGDINSPESFRKEVVAEIENEERLLEKLSRTNKGNTIGYAITIGLLILSIALIFNEPYGLIIWLIVAFLLYSFNFIILFLPTTRREDKPDSCHRSYNPKDIIGPVRFLLKKRRWLAIEIGLTMFLGGMVPLALSFFIIFGVGLVFTIYFGFLTSVLEQGIATLVIIQMLFIILFFVMMIILRPQSQGFTKIATSLRTRLGEARSQSTIAFIWVIAFIALLLAVIGVLFFGAILLTGSTLAIVIGLEVRVGLNILLFCLVLLVEVFIMRHFQAVSSRKMAMGILPNRIETLKKSVLEPLDAMIVKMKSSSSWLFDEAELNKLKARYFPLVIYDLIELNFFGHSPIYVVGPRVKYILDERVMPYLGKT